MKVTFNRQKISNAVAPLMCAVSGKSTLTAIEGILIQAEEDGNCILTTFDLEKGIRLTVQGEVEESGAYVLNAQKFSQTLRVMEGENVTLTVDEKMQACIYCGKSTHRMNALLASDFPAVPNLTTEDGFEISQATLKEMLAKSMYAMASADQRPVLNGCFMKVTEKQLLTVACDSCKLAKCSVETQIENKNNGGEELNFSFIVPTKTVNELFKLLKDDERETVRIYMSRKNIVLHFKDMIFFSRLIDGAYIDYDRIILKNHKINFKVERNAFISALERAALVTEEKVAGSVRAHVRLNLEGDLLKISATSALGSTYDELVVEHEGEDMVISFNNRYLIDSLTASASDAVKVSMTSALTSINIEPAEEKEGVKELFMLLPVRMKE